MSKTLASWCVATAALGLTATMAIAAECPGYNFDQVCANGDPFCRVHVLYPSGPAVVVIDVDGNVYDADMSNRRRCGGASIHPGASGSQQHHGHHHHHSY